MSFFRMLSTFSISLLCAVVQAQSGNSTNTPSSSDEACAQVYQYQQEYYTANPDASGFRLPSDVAYACQQSVLLNQDDTASLLTGLQAWVQWQSTLAWVKDPPANWPFPAVDLVGALQDLGDQVANGTITQEIDFEWKLVDLIVSLRDGHFTFFPDAYNVFSFFNPLGNIVSVSADGQQLPEVYFYNDLMATDVQGWSPSPVSRINGTEVVQWLSQRAFNETLTFQDLDAQYNQLFYSINAPATGGQYGYFNVPSLSRYYGSSITVDFQNGSEISPPLMAYSSQDFSNVVDGDSFYQTFCNVTVKAAAAAPTTSNTKKSFKVMKAATTDPVSITITSATPSPTATPPPSNPNQDRPQYPSPVAISSDGSLAGYFSDEESDLAILSVYAMSEEDQLSAQQTLTKFLSRCRELAKTRLIVDVSQNGGGTVGVSYDIFKQLFPTLEPYLGGQWRAHDQINVLGSLITLTAQQAVEAEPNNLEYQQNLGAYSIFDATSVTNNSGAPYETWNELFGPVKIHGDDFSNQFELELSNALYDESSSGFIPSGYANNTDIAPQPFKTENIILFGDAYCASACTIFSHMMKYQAKVKSIVAGGRPQEGPAQFIGGVKGNRVMALSNTIQYVGAFYELAPSDAIKEANKTQLKDLADNAEVLLLRNDQRLGPVQVNVLNAISQYDDTQTPLQFLYEAADCRLWYQAQDFLDITSLWNRVGQQAFGLNGTEPYSLCVTGSTGDRSSLSGNAKLFDNGQITNVTGYDPDAYTATSTTASPTSSDTPNSEPSTSDTPPSSSSSSAAANGSTSAFKVSVSSAIVATVLGFVMVLFL